jgi:membrane protease YdiL (CAAX protease family)
MMMEPDRFRSRRPRTTPILPWGWYDVGLTLLWALPFSLLAWGLARLLQNVPGWSTGAGLVDPGTYMVGAGVYVALTIGVYLSVARRAGWAVLGVRSTSFMNYLLVIPLFLTGLMGLALTNMALVQLVGNFENPQIATISEGQPLGQAEILALLLLVAGIVPVVEELFFRGLIYPLMRQRMPAFFAVVLNALLFAVVHFIPILIPGLFVVGLCLAYIRERSGSIWPCVLFHALQNALAILAISLVLN